MHKYYSIKSEQWNLVQGVPLSMVDFKAIQLIMLKQISNYTIFWE